MNCYCVTFVDCVKVAPRKIQQDMQLQLISQITHVVAHCRALTVNLQETHKHQLVTGKCNYIVYKQHIFANNTYIILMTERGAPLSFAEF